jgi:hypothetical protein
MVNINDIKENYELRFNTIIEKNKIETEKIHKQTEVEKDELLERAVKHTINWQAESNTYPAFEKIVETYRFFFLFFLDKDLNFDERFDEKYRDEFIDTYLPLNSNSLKNLFAENRNLSDIQNIQIG